MRISGFAVWNLCVFGRLALFVRWSWLPVVRRMGIWLFGFGRIFLGAALLHLFDCFFEEFYLLVSEFSVSEIVCLDRA